MSYWQLNNWRVFVSTVLISFSFVYFIDIISAASTTAQSTICIGNCPKGSAGAAGYPFEDNGATYSFSSCTGWRIHPIFGNSRYHGGTDIAAGSGTPLLATHDGEIVKSAYDSGYGNHITIKDDATGFTILYAHMLQPSSLSVGDRVSVGDLVGLVGSTGWSTGPHLHYEVRDTNGTVYNPCCGFLDCEKFSGLSDCTCEARGEYP